MKIKRQILLSICFFLIILACGCAERQEDPVEITLIHSWGTMEEDHVAMRQIYCNFEKENPDVKINLVSMPSGTEMIRKVEDMIQVGKIPDIIFLGGMGKETVYDYMTGNGLAVDLMPYLEEDTEFMNRVAPANLDYWKQEDGKLFTISDVLLLSGGYWYNKDIFMQAGVQSLPETWEEFMEVCRKIERWAEEENNGVKCLQMSSEAYLYFVDHMMEAWEKQQQNSGSMNEVIEKLQKIYEYTKAEGNYSYRDETVRFNEGKSAMYVNGVWGAPMIFEKINVAYALLPSGKGESLSCESTCLGYLLGETGDEREKEASVKFLKYMLSDEVQKRVLCETEQMPANPRINLEDYQEEMPRFCQAAAIVQNAEQKMEVPDNIWTSFQKEMFTENIIDVLEGRKDSGEFIEQLLEK
ncbi:MAG: extracellular solute-binding protein [Lachnospiraceae bacterium]|nr:extracellular solute-binding protein [Lachnospiraceae bacterium]